MSKIYSWFEKCSSCKGIFEFSPSGVILKFRYSTADWHICPICKKLTIVRKTNLSVNI